MHLTFIPSAAEVAAFDVFTLTVRTHEPVADPFRAVSLTGTFGGRDVTGFCDARDGSVYRVRFMPTEAGRYEYTVTFRHGETEETFSGTFTATDAGRKGLVRAEGWHFVWSGTGEPFFWNGTTAYMMAGLSESEMLAAVDRMGRLGVNHLRVALCPTRQKDGGRWYEPQVAPDETFSYLYGPWLDRRPDSQTEPDWDLTRFDVAYWQKYERLLERARQYDIAVQVVFFVDAQEPQNYPFDRERLGDDPDERRYFAYAAARLAAFSNVEWCLTNEWKLFRPDEWVDAVGAYLRSQDPYGHLMTVHGHGVFPFRTSEWCTHALFQVWDEHGGYKWTLEKRAEQEATGRIIPQVNEEYGYEDHYPGPWGEGRVAPARNAWSRVRVAWEITMGGGWQTTGESAASGAGGWINGRGDNDELLTYHQHLVRFFAAFDWTRLAPRPDLAGGAMVLAEPGVRYVAYVPAGEPLPTITGAEGFPCRWYDPRTGQFADATGSDGDWVALLEKP
jgi:hypothetical protein